MGRDRDAWNRLLAWASKQKNAADASAIAAGDVRHLAGGQLLEAYEITANDWRTKVTQAVEALRRYDLAR